MSGLSDLHGLQAACATWALSADLDQTSGTLYFTGTTCQLGLVLQPATSWIMTDSAAMCRCVKTVTKKVTMQASMLLMSTYSPHFLRADHPQLGYNLPDCAAGLPFVIRLFCRHIPVIWCSHIWLEEAQESSLLDSTQ